MYTRSTFAERQAGLLPSCKGLFIYLQTWSHERMKGGIKGQMTEAKDTKRGNENGIKVGV